MSRGISPVLIRNYGLFWNRDDVFWGRPKLQGHLKGIRAGAKKSDLVDFRNQSGIYVLYADYDMVYVGQAGSGNFGLFNRLRQHKTDALSGRWNKFSWFGLYPAHDHALDLEGVQTYPNDRTILNHLEAVLIYSAEPSLNRQGGKFGARVHQYLQHRDEDLLGPTQEVMMHTLYRKSRQK